MNPVTQVISTAFPTLNQTAGRQLKTAQEFRDFFEAIPEEKWCSYLSLSFDDDGIGCAVQHLGFAESQFIGCLIYKTFGTSIGTINDGHDTRFNQPTPKARILAALDEIIANESKG